MVLGNWLEQFGVRLKLACLYRRRSRPRRRQRRWGPGFSPRAAEVLEVRQLLNATVTITANLPNAAEPNGGAATNGQFTVSRTGDPSQTLGVPITISGTAKNGADYTTVQPGVMFASGQSNFTITITPLADDATEASEGDGASGSETVVLTVGSGSGYTVGTPASATVTIAPSPPPQVSISASQPSAAEPGGGVSATNGQFTLTRTGNISQALAVNLAISGTAANGTDYTTVSTTAGFGANQATTTITVTPLADDSSDTSEGDSATGTETVTLAIATGTGYTPTGGNATVTITDAPAQVGIAATQSSATEPGGSISAVNGQFTLTRSGNTSQSLTVNLAISGTAADGTDYTNVPATATFSANQATTMITITPLADDASDMSEGDSATGTETVIMAIATGPGYVSTGGNATVTITDAPPQVSISASQSSAAEPVGGGSATNGQFTLTRTGNYSQSLTVNLAILGTALSGTDYTSVPTTATFAANQATTTITITPLADDASDASENDGASGIETVIMAIATGTGYAPTGGNATVNITDAPPTVSIAATQSSAAEPGAGGSGANGQFTLTRSGNSSQSLTVNLAISGTALSGTDYTSVPATATFAAGAATTTITITPLPDDASEMSENETNMATETVIMAIATGSGYAPTGGNATVTITDAPPTVSIAATQSTAAEPGGGVSATNGQFTLTRSGNYSQSLTVNLAVSGTALSGTDYTSVPATATFAAGAATTTITITPLADDASDMSEGDSAVGAETVILAIATGTGYVPAGGNSTVTIIDAPPTVSIVASQPNATEPGQGISAVNGQFTLTRSGNYSQALTVNLAISGTALDGADYTDVPTTATFAANQNTTTITITPLADDATEMAENESDMATETVIIAIANGSGYAPTGGNATVTITDAPPTVSIVASQPNAAEPETGVSGTNGQFTLTRSGNYSQALTVNLAISGTAADGSDYTNVPATATFAAGAGNTTITITPLADDGNEAAENDHATGNETVIMAIATGSGYVPTGGNATVTIAEAPPIVSITASQPNAAEPNGGPAVNGQFTLTRTGDLSQPLTVGLNIAGSAMNGIDYTDGTGALPGSVTFSAGQSIQTITIAPVQDNDFGTNDAVVLSLNPEATYVVGSPASAVVTIADTPFGDDWFGPAPYRGPAAVTIVPSSIDITTLQTLLLRGSFTDSSPGDVVKDTWMVIAPDGSITQVRTNPQGNDVTGQWKDEFQFVPTQAGNYTVTLRVTDSYYGVTVSATANVGVVTPLGPSSVVLAPTAGNITTNQSLLLSAAFHDPDPDPLVTDTWTITSPDGSVSTQVDTDPIVVNGNGTDAFEFVPTAAGNYTISLTIRDSDSGLSRSSSTTVTVSAAAPAGPSSVWIAPLPAHVKAGESINLTGAFIDYDSAPSLSAAWTVIGPEGETVATQNDNPSVASGTGSDKFAVNFAEAGTYTVNLAVTDAHTGVTGSASASVVVGQRSAPLAASLVNPINSATLGQTVFLSGSIVDDDPDAYLTDSWLVTGPSGIADQIQIPYVTGTSTAGAPD